MSTPTPRTIPVARLELETREHRLRARIDQLLDERERLWDDRERIRKQYERQHRRAEFWKRRAERQEGAYALILQRRRAKAKGAA